MVSPQSGYEFEQYSLMGKKIWRDEPSSVGQDKVRGRRNQVSAASQVRTLRVIAKGRIVEAQESFIASSRSPREMRGFVTSSLGKWGIDGANKDIIEVLVSELVSNVVRHTGNVGSIHIATDGKTFRAEVLDHSTDDAIKRSPVALDPTGRGLQIVEELATAWGTEPKGDHKVVWFELALSPG